jgi:hypothetical protein
MKKNEQNTHQQAIGSPVTLGIQIVAARDIGSQLIVGREVERLIGPWRITGAGGAEAACVGDVQLSQTDDHRLMSSHAFIVDGISIDAVLGQI